jgi:hypothetical protein
MSPTEMRPCSLTNQLKMQETTVGTLAAILQVPGATQWIRKYHRMFVMCVIVTNQV